MIKIIYNSPAMPQYPYDVHLGASYECQKFKDKYIVKGFDFEREFSLDFLKQIFKPCNGYSWEMLNEKKSQTDINAVKKNRINKTK